MRLLFVMHVLGLGAMGLFLLSAVTRGSPLPSYRSSVPTAIDDSSSARLLEERQDEMLRIRGVFVNDSTWTGPLTYKLEVRRTGDAGTSRSTQSGRFDTAPMQIDTLSTVRVNVQSGDRVEMHLSIRQDQTLVDEVRQRRTF